MDTTQEIILSIINEHIEGHIIDNHHVDEELTNLGLDSITFIRIVVTLEEIFEIEVPDEKLLISEMNTVNKMIDIVSQAHQNINKG